MGNPSDNAKAERCFKTLKREEVDLNDDRTFDEARANLDRFIADVYHTKRLHASRDDRTPVEFEAAHAPAADD